MTQPRRSDPLPLGGEDGLPYSKGLMTRSLITTGVPAESAYEIARRVESDLILRGALATDLERLQELAVGVLGEAGAEEAVGRLRRYGELRALDLPIILLVGGATGTGKSTVATEVAYRLGITRVTSTDFVRQTMRAFFSSEFMPSIHYSSFEAGLALADEDGPDAAVRGFFDQTRNVLVGVRAAIERALVEGWSMVLEGVHLVPGLLPTEIHGALLVQCVLAIPDEDEHATHFFIRDEASSGVRPVGKYLERLGEIRAVQDAIVERARRTGVPVIENSDIDTAIGAVLELVLSSASPPGLRAAASADEQHEPATVSAATERGA